MDFYNLEQCPICNATPIFDNDIGGIVAKEFVCNHCGRYAITLDFFDGALNSGDNADVRAMIHSYLQGTTDIHRIPCFCMEKISCPEKYYCLTIGDLGLTMTEAIINVVERPQVAVITAFPANFLSKDYNEPFIKKVMQSVSGEDDWRKGDPVKFEPDYFCNNLGFEFTIASDRQNKETFIRKFRTGKYKSNDVDSDFFHFIRTAIEKKSEKKYSVEEVCVCVLCLLDLTSWVLDEYGSQAYCLVDGPRAEFFSAIKAGYIDTGKFSNIYIIFPSFDARWWVWDVAYDEKAFMQLTEEEIVSGEYPFALLKPYHDKLFNT